jgi:hypothetical protein
MTVLQRLFPPKFDERFEGRRAALWLLGLFVALKLVMSVNSIANTESVAAGADGFALASYGGDGAAAVLMLFALGAVDQLILALLGIAALVRYRAMVPFVYLLLLVDQVGRRMVISAHDIERAAGTAAGASYLVYALLALLFAGLALSLLGRGEVGARAED